MTKLDSVASVSSPDEPAMLCVCRECYGTGQDVDPPDANGEGGWIEPCQRCSGHGLVETGDPDVVGMAVAGLRVEVQRMRDALESLLPGLELDLRYAGYDEDRDAMRHRIKTVREALRMPL